MKRRNVVFALPALLAARAQAASASQGEGGVVKFGQSASLTGGQAAYGNDVRDGILAAFALANRSGRGPRFELITRDDGGVKERTKENTKALIDAGVAALLGYTSGAGAEVCTAMVEQAQLAQIGTASGNMGIRDPKLSMQYHTRVGYDIEYKRMVSYVKEFGMKRVGYVYLKDTSAANALAMTNALKAVDLNTTIAIGLDRNTKSFEAEAQKLLAAKLDGILFTTNSAPIAAIAEQMMRGKYSGMYFASSFAGQPLIEAMTHVDQPVIMTHVVPRPNALALPVVNRCRDELGQLGKSSAMGFTAMEGFITGAVAVEAVRAGIKGNGISRTRFRDALAGLRTDLGGYKIDFTSSQQGSRYVDIVQIDRTGRIIS